MTIIQPFPGKASKSELVRWQKLAMNKYRRREGLFLAEGCKVIEDLQKSRWQIEALLGMAGKEDIYSRFLGTPAIYPDNGKATPGAGTVQSGSMVQKYILSEKEWGKLSQDQAPEGVMAIVKMPVPGNWQARLQEAPGHVLLVDGINNPNNLGAIMRTAHWFGFAMVFLSTGAVDWTHPKVVRTSMGSLFHLEIFDNLNFLEILPVVRTTHLLIGSDVRHGIAPHRQKERTALLLGSESHGVSGEFLEIIDERWHIPGASRAESLSLPQAAAIMMYELTKGSMHGRVSPDHHNH
ncbi:MAG: RNA methyltransferase [Syntrophales bacterium]|jgi:TrmH family RNA methyltransferase|nr:RNA methyltransferase [Syntrophales bacterium]